MTNQALVVSSSQGEVIDSARRRLALTIGSTACGFALPFAPAFAQDFPSRPITLVVPYAPGGSVDAIGRVLAQQLSTKLGQSVVVDNRPGAGGAIGINSVVRSKPDGYTLVFCSMGALTVTVHLTKAPFDPFKDLAPVSLVATSGMVFAASPESPYRTLADVIAAARAKPGAISYSVTGVASQSFLSGEMLKRIAKIDMVPVQYKGGGPAAMAIASNEVLFGIVDSGAILPLAKAGKVRLLAVTGTQRSSSMPEVPTVQESGVPGFVVDTSLALFAPAGMPQPIIDQLASTIKELRTSQELRGQIKFASHETVMGTPGELAETLRSEHQKWGTLIKEAGIKLE